MSERERERVSDGELGWRGTDSGEPTDFSPCNVDPSLTD